MLSPKFYVLREFVKNLLDDIMPGRTLVDVHVERDAASRNYLVMFDVSVVDEPVPSRFDYGKFAHGRHYVYVEPLSDMELASKHPQDFEKQVDDLISNIIAKEEQHAASKRVK